MADRRLFDTHRVLVRVAISAATGMVGAAVASVRLPPLPSALVGWDVAGLVLLALSWAVIARSSVLETRARAGEQDPGRTLVYVVVVVASSVSLLAATGLVRSGQWLAPQLRGGVPVLCLVTVALSWTMTQMAFTFRYAHLFYREDAEGVGGIELPGKEPPTYFDFAYFAFTIGMCFQVSDMSVTSRQIRRAVLLHAVVSFTYNSIILAFVLNLIFGFAS